MTLHIPNRVVVDAADAGEITHGLSSGAMNRLEFLQQRILLLSQHLQALERSESVSQSVLMAHQRRGVILYSHRTQVMVRVGTATAEHVALAAAVHYVRWYLVAQDALEFVHNSCS